MAELQDSQIKDIQVMVRRFEDKLDNFGNQYVRRDIYDIDQKRIEVALGQHSLDIRQIATSGSVEHDKIRVETAKAIKELTDAWDKVQSDFSKNQIRVRDYVISSLVSFLIGGGAIGLVTFIVQHH